MTLDSRIDPGSSLGELVAERPARAQLFERLRLDYCCGGRQTLAAACAKRELELDQVRAALTALDERDLHSTGVESRDWRTLGIGELCAHIVTVHHDGLREAFPRLARLFVTVVRVHAKSEPRLGDAQRLFGEIRGELEPHLASEENNILLPRARKPRLAQGVERSPASRHRAAADSPREALPPCCQGWIAEQTHNWAAQDRRP